MTVNLTPVEPKFLNRLKIAMEEIELVKDLAHKKSINSRCVHRGSISNLKIKLSLVKLFQSIEEEEKLGNLFYKERKTLIPNSVNDFSEQVNHRTISVLNINVKIINKVLANRIQ